ncbi:MAG: IS110 family transposase [Bacteroidales bacterium]|nr:IS110 family transposase [Bacteroidales bacterium]MCF8333805.1 IS110 family transposase [Bacteroidales bacterium]
MNKYIGIDIAKQTFDAYGLTSNKKEEFLQFNQTHTAYQQLIKRFGKDKTYVMEATGPYYMKLATFLYEKNIAVAVVNPLIIKRFAQMNLQRAKTDKKDAQTIHNYAFYQGVNLWTPPSKAVKQMQQILSSLELINKQMTATKNQLKAFKASGSVDSQVSQSLKTILTKYAREMKRLEEQLDHIVKTHYPATQKRLNSIPGLGKKAIAVLIAVTDNFEKFVHYKQLIAFVGFSPRVYESGTSVKGKGHLCKLGKAHVRKQLYMNAWSAKFHNKSCVEMYERLKAKGKPERVIKIAIANKLLKQAFAVVNNQTIYDPNFVSKPYAASA